MILGLIAFAATFLLTIRKPIVGFGLILAALPSYLIRFEILGVPTTLLETMVGAFLLGVLITNYKPEAWRKLRSLGTVNYVVGLFVLSAVVEALISPDFVKALGQLKAFVIEPALLFYAYAILPKRDNKIPLQFLFWSAFLISLFGIVQYYTHMLLPLRFWGNGEEVKRITSVFEYPNALALYLAPLLLFFTTLHAKGYGLVRKHWSMIGIFLMFAALVLTFSRGALLGVVAGLGLLLMNQKKVSLKKAAITGALALIVISPLIYNRFKGTFHDGSSQERLSMYKIAANQLLESPLLGNGLYGFRTTLQNAPEYKGEILNYPHNVLLNFWLETGMLGMLAFAALIFLSFAEYRIKPSAVKYAAALYLVVMLIHGLVDAPYFKNDLSILFWVMLALSHND